jgi:hypothetical protein
LDQEKYSGDERDIAAALTADKVKDYYKAYKDLMKSNDNAVADNAATILDYEKDLGIRKSDGHKNEVY